MSVTEMSITNPKKQLEFYKQLTEQLQQENQQLKDKLNGVYEERDYLFNKLSVENKYIQQQRDLYKSVIDEIYEYIKQYEELIYDANVDDDVSYVPSNNLLEILDKANIKENE